MPGPECPRCGCRDGTDVSEIQWMGHVRAVRLCRHCGRQYGYNVETVTTSDAVQIETRPVMLDSDGAVPYLTTRCPCGSGRTRVTRTLPPQPLGTVVRWHKCQECGKNFKSMQCSNS